MIQKTPIQITTFKKFETFKDFILKCDPSNLTRLYDDINTTTESIAEVRLCIHDIDYLYSQSELHAGVDYMEQWLKYINVFSGINKPLASTYDVAVYLYSKYGHFYLPDLKIIFERIMRKEDHYGPFYGSVDAQVIIAGFHHYHHERELEIKKNLLFVKQMLSVDIDKEFTKARTEVETEYRKSHPKKFMEMGKTITMKAFERAAPRQQKIREEYERKYGVKSSK